MLIEKNSIQKIYNKNGEFLGTFVPKHVEFEILNKQNNNIYFSKDQIKRISNELTLFDAGIVIDLLSYLDPFDLRLKFQGRELNFNDFLVILEVGETRTREMIQKLEKLEILTVDKKGRKKFYRMNEKFHTFDEKQDGFSISHNELIAISKNLSHNQKGFIYKIIPYINSINSYICLKQSETNFKKMGVLSQEELAKVIKVDPDTVAKHANFLVEENILFSKRNGKNINYIFNEFKELEDITEFILELEEKIEKTIDNSTKVEKAKERRKKRAELLQELPYNIGLNGNKTWKAIFKEFGEECALSGEKDEVTWDHFIPIDTGHGGTIIGNISPMIRSLNSSKNSKHPVKWLEDSVNKGLFAKQKADALIEYLAKENKLSVDDFKNYVDWCMKNPRTAEEVIKNGDKTSMELWKEKNKNKLPQRI